jgi:BCD family chlorophyll transporter-like MFS transporter
MSFIGVAILLITFIVFALSSFAEIRALVTPGLILLGIGLGVWNVGTLGLMVDLSPAGRAGTFLGFWTLVVTFARGLGVSGGGILRDVGFQIGGTFTVSYGATFVIGAAGLALALWALRRVHTQDVALQITPETSGTDTAAILANALD